MTPVPCPESVFARVQARPGAVWLDGGGTGWSILAWDPVDVVSAGAGWPAAGRDLGRPAERAAAPFVGGVIGYVGYGAGHRVLPVPAEAAPPEPEVWLARYTGALCFEHATQSWHATGTASLDDVRGAPRARLAPATARVLPGWTAETWHRKVGRIHALLSEGDCYQVNLTRAVHLTGVADPFAVYRRLRASPAPFGAYLRLSDDLAVLCNSPERFLAADGRDVQTDPIKGTRPRSDDAATDRAAATALAGSAKDLAELTMIVDLVRNDLGAVAELGSVQTGPRRLTAHPNVWHSAQRVSARLREGLDVWDALAATFPPGSVTGAPKVRACHRIAELEATPRGVYCGAIGYASDCGRSGWNVAIRTGVWHAGAARYHVGGGIVIASDPHEEWEETRAKGTELARAFGIAP